MIVSCDNIIKTIYYDGHLIRKVYGCDGRLVYEEDGLFLLNHYYSGGTTIERKIDCSETAYKNVSCQDVKIVWQCADDPYLRDSTIGDCATGIDDYAYDGCTGLTSVTIGNGVSYIGRNGFYNCPNLKRINSNTNGVFNIPSGITSFGSMATFEKCSSMRSISIPAAITTIPNRCFKDCSGLTAVTLSTGITSIEDNAFSGCTSLANVTMESYIPPSIGTGVFPSGTTINVPCADMYKTTPGWDVYASQIVGYSSTCRRKLLARYSDSTSYVVYCDYNGILSSAETRAHSTSYSAMTGCAVGDCTVEIQANAFSGFTALTDVSLGTGLTTIGDSAFEGCSGLTSIVIKENVTSIGGSCFMNCSNLENITVRAIQPPDLGYLAFLSIKSGYKIYVPAESVDTYKNANRWSTFASHIQAIP